MLLLGIVRRTSILDLSRHIAKGTVSWATLLVLRLLVLALILGLANITLKDVVIHVDLQ